MTDTPLPQKLGIREGASVAFVGAPAGFRQTLGALPRGVSVRKQARGPLDVIVFFTKKNADLGRRFGALARALARSTARGPLRSSPATGAS